MVRSLKSFRSSSGMLLLISLISISILLLITTSETASAHAPEDMVVEYDFDTWILNVTVTHVTSDRDNHYVDKILVQKNGEDYVEKEYARQPTSDTFTYLKVVEAVDGDVIDVRAEDKSSGFIERQITISGPERPLNLTISPQPTELVEGSSHDLIIEAESSGHPVKRVKLTLDHTIGDVTEILSGDPGNYTFSLSLPRVRIDTDAWLNFTGTRGGYSDGILDIPFTVTDIPGSNLILIDGSGNFDSLTEGTDITITLDLEADDASLTGALVTLDHESGSSTPVQDLGGGEYSFTFTAPEVDADTNVTLNISAEISGYDEGSLSLVLMIVNDPDPLDITIIEFNGSILSGSDQVIGIHVHSEGIGVNDVILTLQPSGGETLETTGLGNGDYSFRYASEEVNVNTRITINVTATIHGYRTAALDIMFMVTLIPPEPVNLLCVKLLPGVETLPAASRTDFTVYALFDCAPFEGAVVEVTHISGVLTNIIDEGDGMFSFSYLAPDVENDLTETFTITVFKPDYGEMTRAYSFTIAGTGDGGSTRGGLNAGSFDEPEKDADPSSDRGFSASEQAFTFAKTLGFLILVGLAIAFTKRAIVIFGSSGRR